MTQYKYNADGTPALDQDGIPIRELPLEKQREIFKDAVLRHHNSGFQCLDSNGDSIAKFYRILRDKNNTIFGIEFRSLIINIFGEQIRHDVRFTGKQQLKQLHKILGDFLETIEEDGHKMK